MGERYQRAKGKIFERELAEWFSQITKTKWRRTPLSGGLCMDFPGDIMKIGNFPTILDNILIEAKFQKKLSIGSWIKQTEEETKDADLKRWLLFFKKMGKIYVVMDIDHFEKWIKKHE